MLKQRNALRSTSVIHNLLYSTSDYTAQTMPDLFEERRRTLYGPLRQCESIHRVDYTWKDDYSPQGKFPGWCLKGKPPHFGDSDRD
ncbi:uncharacterized protein CDAR_465871 [Caerostris darwini]|uniref:Uncharacterized protein n=1 Tax=Caerostris darwini TaxID=1538125 RepID=A0AAV4RQT9_9ARAC|nr:uncharacterized protein CDAR_465871 [Caerostris darwini]